MTEGAAEVDLMSLLSKANDLGRPGARDVLPVASLVLLVAGLFAAGAPGRSPDMRRALLVAGHLSVIDFGLLILSIVAISIFLQPVISVLVALLQDRVRWRLARSISLARARHKKSLREMTEDRLHRLYRELDIRNAEPEAGAQLEGDVEELSEKLRQYPRVGRVRATKLGNILAAAEEDAGSPYGLDSRVVLPRLELLLPPSAEKELSSRRDDLVFASRFCATLLLAAIVSAGMLARYGAWLLIPATVAVFASLSYRNAIAAAVAYGELLRVVFGLYRFLIYEAFHFPLPRSLAEEQEMGRELTEFFHTGYSPGVMYAHTQSILKKDVSEA
jgi:hypothetical protein